MGKVFSSSSCGKLRAVFCVVKNLAELRMLGDIFLSVVVALIFFQERVLNCVEVVFD